MTNTAFYTYLDVVSPRVPWVSPGNVYRPSFLVSHVQEDPSNNRIHSLEAPMGKSPRGYDVIKAKTPPLHRELRAEFKDIRMAILFLLTSHQPLLFTP